MKILYVSDDEKVSGTEKEVLAYEASLLDPLAWLALPIVRSRAGFMGSMTPGLIDSYLNSEQLDAVARIANLAPLMKAVFDERDRQWGKDWRERDSGGYANLCALDEAFNEAVKRP